MFGNILATARGLFESEGFAYVSTNRIAEQANISVSSLYQYFPNCESIAYEEVSAQAVSEMKQHALEVMNLPIEESIPKHIGWVFDIFEEHYFVLLELIDKVPELRHQAQAYSFDNLIHRTTSTYLQEHFYGVDRPVIDKKVYVIVKSVIGTIRGHLGDKSAYINRDELIEELAQFILVYSSRM